jgi:hypothetical protein
MLILNFFYKIIQLFNKKTYLLNKVFTLFKNMKFNVKKVNQINKEVNIKNIFIFIKYTEKSVNNIYFL